MWEGVSSRTDRTGGAEAGDIRPLKPPCTQIGEVELPVSRLCLSVFHLFVAARSPVPSTLTNFLDTAV